MKNMNPLFHLTFMALVLSAAPVKSQITSAKPSFKALAWTEDISDLYYADSHDTSKVLPISLYTHARSDSYYFNSGMTVLRFFRQNTDPASKEPYIEVANVDLQDVGPKPLLIFFRDKKDPTRYQIVALPDDLASFGSGTYKFVNYTSGPVRINLGSDKADLAPREAKVVKGKPRTIAGVPNVLDVQVVTGKPPQTRQAFGNIWAYKETLRQLVFIVETGPGPGPMNVEVKRISEDPNFVPLPPKPVTASAAPSTQANETPSNPQ
ncbi:MAG: hypothetical protein SFU85_06680 [Candidatus Methylacidiphilales bacterium]|nr:hypothetical protein [Candidatus Methylacidiphilales bacterium]